MTEFEQLAEEMEPIFRQIQAVKDRHGITSLTIECLPLVDQFWGSHGGKGDFVATRRYHHKRDMITKFKKVK